MKSPSQLFLLCLIAWLVGTAWPGLGLSINRLIIGLALLILSVIWWHHRRLAALFLLVSIYLLAQSYFYWYIQRITPTVTYFEVQDFTLKVLDKPTKKDDLARYQGQTPGGWYILFSLPRAVVITPGSEVRIRGAPRPMPGNTLSLVKNHVFASLSKPIILTIQPAQLNWWERLIVSSRFTFDTTVSRLLAEPRASLFAGIVVGLKSDLPSDIVTQFQIAGLSHIIAVSGFNITIAVKLLTRFTQRFGRLLNFIVSIIAILFFVVFTGASASVVRAGILASLFILARTIGRRASVPRLLIFTATIMTIQNPLILRYDIGFQLSFAAIFGLVLFGAPLQKLFDFLRLPDWLNETMSATVAAQLTTMPIIIYYFGNFSPYSLLANILVGPLIPYLTAFGIPLVILVSLLPILSWLNYPFDLVLRYILWVVAKIAVLLGATILLPTLPLLVWISYPIFLAGLALVLKPKEA